MKHAVLLCLALLAGQASARQIPSDLSGMRGFNYTTSRDDSIGPRNHSGLWLKYNQADVDRDLDNARRLNLNQVRVFVPFSAWTTDKATFNKNLLNFMLACHQRGIGVMLGLIDEPRNMADNPAAFPQLQEWIADMVKVVGHEPSLEFWDASNEPDGGSQRDTAARQGRLNLARYMAGILHKLDKKTPVTIGCIHVACMKETVSSVDVLSFHDYSPTREQIRDRIKEAKDFAATVRKPVFSTEMGCIGRANPYDVTLQEFMRANMGWYLWELTITKEWGDVHGVFYPDGTVRDPTIVSAILGFFRNRGPNVVLEDPDRERWVTRAVTDGRNWLAQPDPDWHEGLRQAEIEANLLEAAQLVPMREPPTRTVDLLHTAPPDLPALQAIVRGYISILEAHETSRPLASAVR
jgi:hypothetical protein